MSGEDVKEFKPGTKAVAGNQTSTTERLVGNAGVAMVVLSLCMCVTSRSALMACPLLKPIIAVGSMSLTAYIVHVAGMQIFGLEEGMAPSSHMLFVFILAMAANLARLVP